MARSFVWLLLTLLFAVLATASTLLSLEGGDSGWAIRSEASRGAGTLQQERHHTARMHSASLDDDDDDTDDTDDDCDVSCSDDDVEYSLEVTAVALPPEAQSVLKTEWDALGPARGHVTLPERPPRATAS